MEISYSDGQSVESRILDLVRASTSIDSSAAPGLELYRDWPVRYHLCPERANLVRHLNFHDLEVAELGAGMGAVSRFLAEQSKRLTVVEGTQARYSVLSSRLRDLKNWSGHVGNFDQVPATPHDVVCVVGVLEYSDVYMTPPAEFDGTVYDWFLQLASKWIHDQGVVILAIENKLGLKYLAGAPEDHTDRRFDGICGYSKQTSPRTFSLRELTQMFSKAGFEAIEQYFPFPDYKVPTAVLSRKFIDEAVELVPTLAMSRPFESYGVAHSQLYPELLALDSLTRAGLGADFSNSFLLVAARDPKSPVLKKLLSTTRDHKAVAWHYANYRKQATVTEFLDREKGIAVRKTLRSRPELDTATFPSKHFTVTWTRPVAETVHQTPFLREQLVRTVHFEGVEKAYAELLAFLKWSIRPTDQPLKGKSLDAILTNAQVASHGYTLFDQEWSIDKPLSASWFVLRNVLSLGIDSPRWQKGSRFVSLAALYQALCTDLGLSSDLEKDMAHEAELQSVISLDASVERHIQNLRTLILRAPERDSLLPARLQRYKKLVPSPLRKLSKKALQVGERLSETASLSQQIFKRVF